MSAAAEAPPIQRRSRRHAGGRTIRDVAELAGVSAMTVSRVLNDDRNVRPETRDRVRAAIAELRFTPNPAARSLAGAERVRLGFVFGDAGASWLSEFLMGSLAALRNGDTQLAVETCDPDLADLSPIARMARDGVHGVLLTPPMCDSPEVMAMLAEAEAAVLAIGPMHPGEGALSVFVDGRAAAVAMTRHLLALGHRRVAFIAGDPGHQAAIERRAGFLDAMAEAGLPVDPALTREGMFSYRSALEPAEALLTLADRPTAVFAANDDMAAATVAVAHRLGLDVPGDLSVCGFDDTVLASAIWPQLTTIRQPIAAMARAAVELLVEEVRARRSGRRGPPPRAQFPFELVQRGSSGPPRA